MWKVWIGCSRQVGLNGGDDKEKRGSGCCVVVEMGIVGLDEVWGGGGRR